MITSADLNRRSWVWLLATLATFLSNNFWVYALTTFLLLSFARIRELNPISLFCVTLLAAPAYIASQVPGIGGINYFFDLNHTRIVTAAILIPAAFLSARAPSRTEAFKAPTTDIFVIGYLLSVVGSHAFVDSFTEILRIAFYMILDVWLPYYVASRTLVNAERLKDFAGTFLALSILLSLIAIFETSRHWLLYESLREPLGAAYGGFYLTRDAGGPLRAVGATAQPIALGYLLMIGIGFYFGFKFDGRWSRLVIGLVLLAGLVSTFSRGPWVGSFVMLTTLLFLNRGLIYTLVLFISLAVGFGIAQAVLPEWSQVTRYLPFVGQVENQNVEYRWQLLSISFEVWKSNPFLGNPRFVDDPIMEQMRQGQGIIDIVNTYVQTLLAHGIVGLFFFLLAFLTAMWSLIRIKDGSDSIATPSLPKVVFCILLGVAMTIGTVSSISYIPTLYWILIGCGAGYGSKYQVTSRTKDRFRISKRRSAG